MVTASKKSASGCGCSGSTGSNQINFSFMNGLFNRGANSTKGTCAPNSITKALADGIVAPLASLLTTAELAAARDFVAGRIKLSAVNFSNNADLANALDSFLKDQLGVEADIVYEIDQTKTVGLVSVAIPGATSTISVNKGMTSVAAWALVVKTVADDYTQIIGGISGSSTSVSA